MLIAFIPNFAAGELILNPWLDVIIPLVFGGLVMGVAVFLYRMEVANEVKLAEVESDHEFLHLQRRIRRRKQIAVMIGVIGGLLTLANSWVPWKRFPILPSIYVLVLLGLVTWILLLALADFASSRLYAQMNLKIVRQKQREMEEALLKMKQADRNGEIPERN